MKFNQYLIVLSNLFHLFIKSCQIHIPWVSQHPRPRWTGPNLCVVVVSRVLVCESKSSVTKALVIPRIGWSWMFNGNFRILTWRYLLYHIRPYFAGIFPSIGLNIGLLYGRYLQFRFLKWPLIYGGFHSHGTPIYRWFVKLSISAMRDPHWKPSNRWFQY